MRKGSAGWLLAACLFLGICLSGCEGITAAQQQESQPKVQMAERQQESQPKVQMAQQQGIQEVKSISAGNYAYECLNEVEKQLYDQMLNGILTFQEDIPLPVVEVDVLERAYHAINCDYGGLFWVNGYTYTTYTQAGRVISLEFSPSYTMNQEKKQEYQQQIDQVVDRWLSGIAIHDSDYDKARYVFETLVSQVDYREGALESQNILSVFLYGETVCQGYACATQYLLRLLGVPCMVVSGTANNEAHAWNIAMLDGQYYHMDTTWGNSSYLDQEHRESKYMNYSFMCMTDQEIGRTHRLQMEFPMPACVSMEDNYFVRENCYFESWEPDSIGQLFQEARDAGEDRMTVKCSDEALYRQMVEYFIDDQHITDYCQDMERIYYMENPESFELAVSFEN